MNDCSAAPLKDRVAIVTGGAGGIGLETSKALQESGATVVISDLNADRGEKVARELGLEFFPADLERALFSCIAKISLSRKGLKCPISLLSTTSRNSRRP